jgi:hypothetical protein
VCKEGISLHFSNTNTTTLLSTLDWLTRQLGDWSCGSDLELVVHHVTQTLVVNYPNVDVSVKFFASNSRIHRLIAVVVVSRFHELVTKIVSSSVFLIKAERGAVLCKTVKSTSLSSQRLDKHSNCHTRGECPIPRMACRCWAISGSIHPSARAEKRTYHQ